MSEQEKKETPVIASIGIFLLGLTAVGVCGYMIAGGFPLPGQALHPGHIAANRDTYEGTTVTVEGYWCEGCIADEPGWRQEGPLSIPGSGPDSFILLELPEYMLPSDVELETDDLIVVTGEYKQVPCYAHCSLYAKKITVKKQGGRRLKWPNDDAQQ